MLSLPRVKWWLLSYSAFLEDALKRLRGSGLGGGGWRGWNAFWNELESICETQYGRESWSLTVQFICKMFNPKALSYKVGRGEKEVALLKLQGALAANSWPFSWICCPKTSETKDSYIRQKSCGWSSSSVPRISDWFPSSSPCLLWHGAGVLREVFKPQYL